MSKMTEAALSRIDNLEIGRYDRGSVKWEGLTDVRGLDLDQIINIEQDGVAMYPDREKPKVGDELNKKAVITLNLPLSRLKSKLKGPNQTAGLEQIKARLKRLSEKVFGGNFIEYDEERWIFRVPHFNGPSAGE